MASGTEEKIAAIPSKASLVLSADSRDCSRLRHAMGFTDFTSTSLLSGQSRGQWRAPLKVWVLVCLAAGTALRPGPGTPGAQWLRIGLMHSTSGWELVGLEFFDGGGCSGQLGPIESKLVGPALAAREATARASLYLSGQVAQAPVGDAVFYPSMNTGRLDIQHSGDRRNAAKQLNDFAIGHSAIIRNTLSFCQ